MTWNVADSQSWLAKQQVSGVNLGLTELIHYRELTYLLKSPANTRIKHHLAGQYLARTKGRGMEFDEARHYQAGDDVRTIDWRVTARTGKTHTKVFREEKDRPIFVMCDLLPSMYFGSQLLFKSVQACHLAALIGWRARQNGDKIGGLLVQQNSLAEIKPKSRQSGLMLWLNQLVANHTLGAQQTASDHAAANDAFNNACRHLRQVAHPGSKIYLISDFQHLDEAAIQNLYQLQKHCEVVACWIHDPLEMQLPNWIGANMPLTDGKRLQRVETAAQRASYQAQANSYFSAAKTALTQYQIKWQAISAGLPLSEQL